MPRPRRSVSPRCVAGLATYMPRGAGGGTVRVVHATARYRGHRVDAGQVRQRAAHRAAPRNLVPLKPRGRALAGETFGLDGGTACLLTKQPGTAGQRFNCPGRPDLTRPRSPHTVIPAGTQTSTSGSARRRGVGEPAGARLTATGRSGPPGSFQQKSNGYAGHRGDSDLRSGIVARPLACVSVGNSALATGTP